MASELVRRDRTSSRWSHTVPTTSAVRRATSTNAWVMSAAIAGSSIGAKGPRPANVSATAIAPNEAACTAAA